jgi:hypothetical protein
MLGTSHMKGIVLYKESYGQRLVCDELLEIERSAALPNLEEQLDWAQHGPYEEPVSNLLVLVEHNNKFAIARHHSMHVRYLLSIISNPALLKSDISYQRIKVIRLSDCSNRFYARIKDFPGNLFPSRLSDQGRKLTGLID